MGTSASVNNRGFNIHICRKCHSKRVGNRLCKHCRGVLCQDCCPHRGQWKESHRGQWKESHRGQWKELHRGQSKVEPSQPHRYGVRSKQNAWNDRRHINQLRNENFSRRSLLVSRQRGSDANATSVVPDRIARNQAIEWKQSRQRLSESREMQTLKDSHSRMFSNRRADGQTRNYNSTGDDFDIRSLSTRDSLRSGLLELDSPQYLGTDRPSTGSVTSHSTISHDNSVRPESGPRETLLRQNIHNILLNETPSRNIPPRQVRPNRFGYGSGANEMTRRQLRPNSFRYETGTRDMSLRPNSFRSERIGENIDHKPTTSHSNRHKSGLMKFLVPRLPERTRKHGEESSNLYGKTAIPVAAHMLQEHPRAIARWKLAECATHTHDGQLVILCSYNFQDKLCECCTNNTFLVLSFPSDPDIPFSDFIHLTECGDMTSSASVEKTYFTLPRRYSVYTFFRGSNIYEAFKTPGECYGISYFDKGLAISVRLQSDFNTINKWMIIFVRYNGKIKRQIVDSYNGKLLFKEPRYLASSNSGEVLYVSDQGRRVILAFNVWGALLFEYSDVELRCPRGLTIDADDNVYVADGLTVVQIKSNGMSSNVLLSTTSGENIADLSFDKKTNTLIVVQCNGTITEFSFSS